MKELVDWEFWGDPKTLKVIGIGLTIAIVGLVLGFVLDTVCFGLAFIGIIITAAASFYLAYWENWAKLKEREKYG